MQEVACYRSRHAAMHVQYSMPGHRAATEPQLWVGWGWGVVRVDGSHYRKNSLHTHSSSHAVLVVSCICDIHAHTLRQEFDVLGDALFVFLSQSA